MQIFVLRFCCLMASLEPGVEGLKWDLPSPTVRCFIGTPKVVGSISIGKVSIE